MRSAKTLEDLLASTEPGAAPPLAPHLGVCRLIPGTMLYPTALTTHHLGQPITAPAHRLLYQVTYGPIPPKHVIDHVCHNLDPGCQLYRQCAHTRCLEPRHIEAVTQLVNVRRGRIRGRIATGVATDDDWLYVANHVRELTARG